MPSKTYSIVGMNFQKAEAIVAALQPGTPVKLIREPTNKYDANAIAVWVDGKHVGYIPSKQNKVLAAFMDQTDLPLMAFDSAKPEGKTLDATFVRSPNSGYPQVEVVE